MIKFILVIMSVAIALGMGYDLYSKMDSQQRTQLIKTVFFVVCCVATAVALVTGFVLLF